MGQSLILITLFVFIIFNQWCNCFFLRTKTQKHSFHRKCVEIQSRCFWPIFNLNAAFVCCFILHILCLFFWLFVFCLDIIVRYLFTCLFPYLSITITPMTSLSLFHNVKIYCVTLYWGMQPMHGEGGWTYTIYIFLQSTCTRLADTVNLAFRY